MVCFAIYRFQLAIYEFVLVMQLICCSYFCLNYLCNYLYQMMF